MTATLPRMTTVSVLEPDDVDLARLDDDGGTRQQLKIADRPPVRDDRFKTPMIPGSREPGMLTTFGVPAVVFIADSPSTMDAATIAARQREGGGAPNQRRPARVWSRWKSLKHALRLFVGVDRR
jgi:hypothetical protein